MTARFFSKSGTGINYSVCGTGDRLVLLHPIAMDKTFWGPLISQMNGRYRFVAIDLPGHGESDRPAVRLTLEQMASCVTELIETDLEGEPVALVGCSMGGMIAQELALRNPALVKALILCNTSHTLPSAAREAMMQRAAAVRRGGMSSVLEATIERWFSQGFRNRNPEVVEAVRARLLGVDPLVHAWCWEAISLLDTEPRLPSLDVPTLVATGGADQSTPPAITQAIAAAIPGSTCRIAPDVGHMLPMETPELLGDWINELLKS